MKPAHLAYPDEGCHVCGRPIGRRVPARHEHSVVPCRDQDCARRVRQTLSRCRVQGEGGRWARHAADLLRAGVFA